PAGCRRRPTAPRAELRAIRADCPASPPPSDVRLRTQRCPEADSRGDERAAAARKLAVLRRFLRWHGTWIHAVMDIQRIDRKRQKQIRQWALYGVGGIAVIALGFWLATLDPAAPSVDKASLWTDTVKRGEMLREVR